MTKKVSTKKKEMEVIPLHDRVLLSEINEKETQTASGIYIPENASSDKGLKKGVVVAVGKGKYDDGKLVPMQVAKGDVVLFSWGDTVTIDSVEYYIVRESEISAIVG